MVHRARLAYMSSRDYRYAANCSYGMMAGYWTAGNWRLAQCDQLRSSDNSATYRNGRTCSWFRRQRWRVANACARVCHSSYRAFLLLRAWATHLPYSAGLGRMSIVILALRPSLKISSAWFSLIWRELTTNGTISSSSG